MSDYPITIARFIALTGITMEAQRVEGGITAPGWPRGSTHWSIAFRRKESDRVLCVDYHMGPALTGEPDIKDVLEAVLGDVVAAETHGTPQELAEEFGIEGDNAWDTVYKAERLFAQLKVARDNAAWFLGEWFERIDDVDPNLDEDEPIKLRLALVDVCLSDYWQGSSEPYLCIPVCKSMTVQEVEESLHEAVRAGDVGRGPPYTVVEWWDAAKEAVNYVMKKGVSPDHKPFFDSLDESTDDPDVTARGY